MKAGLCPIGGLEEPRFVMLVSIGMGLPRHGGNMNAAKCVLHFAAVSEHVVHLLAEIDAAVSDVFRLMEVESCDFDARDASEEEWQHCANPSSPWSVRTAIHASDCLNGVKVLAARPPESTLSVDVGRCWVTLTGSPRRVVVAEDATPAVGRLWVG